MTDRQLLQRFADDNSQAAFAEICRRYTNLVYSVCRRELGETTLAEDAAQAVFLVLARKAPGLKHRADTTLGGWLFQTALLTARNVRRQEQRRSAREQKVTQMQTPQSEGPPEWAEVEPLLNDALQALPASQRTLIIGRFFQEHSLADIGRGLGVSEDAARMRVNRALDRLRRYFAAHGVTLSAAALAALLPLAVRPAPAHAAEALSRLTFSPPAGTPAFTLAQGAIHTMNTHRLRLSLGAAVLVAVFVLGTAGAVQVTTEHRAQVIRAEQQQNSAQAHAIMDQMYATYAAMKSFKCSVETQETPGLFARAADYEIERPNKIRFHHISLYDATRPGQEEMEVSDGSSLYVTSTEMGERRTYGATDRYAKMDFIKNNDYSAFFAWFGGAGVSGELPHTGMPEVALGLRLGPISMGSPEEFVTGPVYSLGQPTRVHKDIMEEKVPVDVVVARMEEHRRVLHGEKLIPSIEAIPIVVTYYIGQADHLLYERTKARMVRPDEWQTETQKVYSQSVNPKLPASDFVFTPPPGSHEVRDTNDLFPNGKT